jgi:hypothetical protein
MAFILEHPLHKAVGNLLNEFADKNGFEPRLDPACGNNKKSGKQHIPLFLSSKALDTRLCCVDAMLLKDGKVIVVIEIEESNIKPTQICGKYLTTALSRVYHHKNEPKPIILEKNSVNFIQVLDISSPHKKEQAKNIEVAIDGKGYGCIKKYDIIHIDKKEKGYIKDLENKLCTVLKKNGVIA